MAGAEAIGMVALGDITPDKFSEADEQLLSTIASSMGVALENARRFDETKRLLSETDARAGELAIINEIGAALAQQLDFDAIVNLIGDRLVSMFQAQAFYIALYDRASNLLRYPYEIENGRRLHRQPIEFGTGLSSQVITERRPLRFGTLEEQDALDGGR